MYRYTFHIVDNEFGDEYDYEGYFCSDAELGQFIKENIEVGNVVTVLFGHEWVPQEDLPNDYRRG